jgi:DNA-binding transcriptional LysR family regulator
MEQSELGPMTDLNSMALIVGIAEAGSLSEAGRALGAPKSTVSRRLAEIEQALGTTLIHRSTRRMSLTDAGQAYVERAKPLVREAQLLHDEIKGRNAKPSGLIRVGATTGFGQSVLGPLICSFMNDHPDVRIALTLSDSRSDIIGDGLDLVVRMGSLPDSELLSKRLGSVTRLLVAAPVYLALRGAPLEPDALRRHDCIVASPGLDTWEFADGTSVRVPWRLAAGSIAMARDAALRGHGVALLPKFLIADDLADGQLQPVLGSHPLPAAQATALMPRDRSPSIAVRKLVTHLGDALSGSML